jgi:RNA binding exosome subunit
MAKLPIHWIEARTYRYATEEESRVEQALGFAMPAGESRREALQGHFGHPLVRLTRRIDDAPSIRTVWERWSTAGLPLAFTSDVDARVDEEGIFHFRLDKQEAFQGRLALATNADVIDVRVKLVAYPAKLDVARRVAHSIVHGAL